MQCPTCHTQVNNESQFCSECGVNLSKQKVDKETEEPDQNKKNWLNKLIISAVLVVILIFWILLNRFYFINEDGSRVTRCNKITGNCVTFSAERIK